MPDCAGKSIGERLSQVAVDTTLPDGSSVRTISHAAIGRLARHPGGGGPDEPAPEGPAPEGPPPAPGPARWRHLEQTALELGIIPARYLRNLGTLGRAGQLRLLASRVGVAGVGGLGGLLVELLARAGVGELVVVDPDTASDDNLNRQLLVTPDSLGRPKVELAARRVASVNPAVSVTAHQAAGDADSFARFFAGCAALVDCLDNLPARWSLQAAARTLGLPMVHGAIAGLSGQVACFFPDDRGLELLYGPEGASPARGIETRVGNPAPTPALVAACQAQEVIKILSGVGTPLRRRLLVFDGLSPYAAVVEL